MENVSQRNERADVEVSRLDLESGEDIRRGNSGRGDGSMRFSRRESSTLIEEIESVRAAEAGDDGGRSFHVADIESSRENMPNGGGGTNCMGTGVSVPDDVLIFSHAFRPTTNAESAAWNCSPVSPLPSDIVSPFSDCPLMADRSAADVHNTAWESRQTEVNQEQIPCILEYGYILAYLAIFGIFGILIRYSLQILFGPNVAKVTNDFTPLYADLPSNMVGSFFMGWFGVIFKMEISFYSKFLAIGLSTGLMGSITTFTSWIQQVVNLTTKGHWVIGIIGLLLGMELAQMSLSLGIETAKLLKQLIGKVYKMEKRCPCFICIPYFDKLQYLNIIIIMIIVGILWGGSIVMIILEFRSHHRSKLWWACAFGPSGVWIRWFMARLNGKGVGSQKHLRWLPIGTLLTNLIAVGLMASLSIISLVVKSNNLKMMIEGLKLGFLGCMSTVSSFVTEVHALHQSSYPWRAYAYTSFTLFLALILGTLIYSVPIWIKGYSY